MNNDQLEGKWKQVKGKFKEKYGELTDDDLKYSEGKFDQMLGRLQEKTGNSKETLKKEIEKLQVKPVFHKKGPQNFEGLFYGKPV